MNNKDINKLIDELCNRGGYLLMIDAGIHSQPELVEGFIEHSKQVLVDYYANNELPI